MSELLIEGYGICLGARKGYLYVRTHKGEETLIPPSTLTGVLITSASTRLSAKSLIILSRFGVELTVMHKGKPMCKVMPATGGAALQTKLAQIEALNNGKRLYSAKMFIKGKLHNQRMVIRQKAREVRNSTLMLELEKDEAAICHTLSLMESSTTIDQVRAYEANAARNYWHAVSLMIPPQLGFGGRVVRNPRDDFNRALNIGYGVLRAKVWSAVLLAGLDPFIGLLHMPRGRHMCLVSDLMEEFRPVVVDRPLITYAMRDPDFMKHAGSFRKVISLMIDTLRANESALSKAILLQARRLASYLRGEIDDYEPFRLKW